MLLVLNQKNSLSIIEIQKYEKILRDLDVVILPQIIYMPLFNKGIYHLGSQFVSDKNITGGVNAKSLKSLNVEYVLIGHYDQREYLDENEYDIAKKLDEVINNGMMPIVCVSESLEEKVRNKGLYIIEKELNRVFSNIKCNPKNVIIAYEPRWNPENDLETSISYINEVMFFIKSYVKDNYNINAKVLYDGNITTKNIQKFLKLNILDGFIVEDSSNDIYDIINIYENING